MSNFTPLLRELISMIAVDTTGTIPPKKHKKNFLDINKNNLLSDMKQ